jgi:hypothetical protein
MTTQEATSGIGATALKSLSLFATSTASLYYSIHLANDRPVSLAAAAACLVCGVGFIYVIAGFATRRTGRRLPAGFSVFDPALIDKQRWASGSWRTDDGGATLSLAQAGEQHAIKVEGLPNGPVNLHVIAFSPSEETYLAVATCDDHGGRSSSSALICRQPDNRLRLRIDDMTPQIDITFRRDRHSGQPSSLRKPQRSRRRR